jgi:hypothetical protein
MPSRSWRSTYDVFSNPASVALAVVESLLDGGLLPGDGVSKDGFLAYLERLKELPAERLGDRMRIWPGRFPELGQYAYRRFISPNPPAWGDPPPVTVAP